MCNLVNVGPHPRHYMSFYGDLMGDALVAAEPYETVGSVRPNQTSQRLYLLHEAGPGEFVARNAWFNIVEPWQVKYPEPGAEAEWQPKIDYSKNASRQNARDDTLLDKKTWKKLMPANRGIVALESFGEWQWQDTGGQPLADNESRPKKAPRTQVYEIAVGDNPIFVLPCVWHSFECRIDGREPFDWVSCAIITTAANSTMQAIHNKPADPAKRRQPAWLEPDDIRPWLDTEGVPPTEAVSLLSQFPAARTHVRPVV